MATWAAAARAGWGEDVGGVVWADQVDDSDRSLEDGLEGGEDECNLLDLRQDSEKAKETEDIEITQRDGGYVDEGHEPQDGNALKDDRDRLQSSNEGGNRGGGGGWVWVQCRGCRVWE